MIENRCPDIVTTGLEDKLLLLTINTRLVDKNVFLIVTQSKLIICRNDEKLSFIRVAKLILNNIG